MFWSKGYAGEIIKLFESSKLKKKKKNTPYKFFINPYTTKPDRMYVVSDSIKYFAINFNRFHLKPVYNHKMKDLR